jgi:hypothetical protein
MDRVKLPKAYVLTSKDAVQEILAVEADLLRGEGIDPAWPGFAEATDETESSE